MIFLFSILMPAFLLLMADAFGLIDLSSRPITRVVKWLSVAAWAWFLPTILQSVFRFDIDSRHLNLWKLFILGVLLMGLISALMKWIWQHYGPAPEGYRRCSHCRKPVLKVMLECPTCRQPLSSKK